MAEAADFDADTQGVIERLRAAVRRRFGEHVGIGNFTQATLGGSNRTILFDLGDGSARRLVLRQETIPPDYTPFLPADVQYRILRVVYDHDVLVPEPVFELDAADELGHGYVVGAIAGESLPKRLLNDAEFATARARFLDQAGTELARIHAIDPALLPELADRLEGVEEFAAGPLEEAAMAWLEERDLALKKVGQAIRVALTGRAVSPPLFDTMAVLGRERTLERLRAAPAHAHRPEAPENP